MSDEHLRTFTLTLEDVREIDAWLDYAAEDMNEQDRPDDAKEIDRLRGLLPS